LNEPFDHRPEFGINQASPFEPEIKKIARKDEKIGHDSLRVTRVVGLHASAPETVEEKHAFFKSGILEALQVDVGKKDRLHDRFPR
jgi:hypothetical protein